MNTAVEVDDGNAALRALVRSAFADWRKRLRDCCDEAVGRGCFRKDIDTAMLADMLVAGLEGALVLSRIQGDTRPLEHAKTMLHQFLASSIVKENSSGGSQREVVPVN